MSSLWSLGSVADFVFDLVEDIPTALSGTRTLEMSDQKRKFVADYMGIDIGSNSIELQYQGPISRLTAADVMDAMQTLGADVASVKLGDYQSKKGSESNLSTAANLFRDSAMAELSKINFPEGADPQYYKALG